MGEVKGGNQETNGQNEEFDYFFVLLKNWKKILLTGLIFCFIGGVIVFFSSHNYSSQSSFVVDLPSTIHSVFGDYSLKTSNPQYYIDRMESNSFNHDLHSDLGIKESNQFLLKINTDEVKKISEDKIIYPKKFDLTVTADRSKDIEKINNDAIALYLKEMDKFILHEAVTQFSRSLNKSIHQLKINIKNQAEFVDSLSFLELTNKYSATNTLEDQQKLAFQEPINNSTEKSILAAMIYSKGNGAQRYIHARLMLEKTTLVELRNSLIKDQTLLAKLTKESDEDRATILNHLFSNHFVVLIPAEKLKTNSLKSVIGKLFIAFIIGVILISMFILIRTYYADKWMSEK